MPKVVSGVEEELEPGFERRTNRAGKAVIRCTFCRDEEFIPSHYNRHRQLHRHIAASTPSTRFLISQKRLRTPSPDFVPPPADFGYEGGDMGGFDAGQFDAGDDVPLEQQYFHDSPPAPVLHRPPAQQPLAQSASTDPRLPTERDIEAVRLQLQRLLEDELGIARENLDADEDGDAEREAAREAELQRLENMAEEFARDLRDDGDFAPFKNATEFSVFVLAHMPSSPMSVTAIRLHLILLKLMKSPNVPSYNGYLELAKSFKLLSNEPPLTEIDGGGIPFYHKSIMAAFERDLNNPRLAEKINPYPRRHSGWKDLCDGTVLGEETADSLLTPMIRLPTNGSHRDFYVEEPVALQDGSFFLPTKWFLVAEEMHCEGHSLSLDGVTLKAEDGLYEVAVYHFDLSQAAQIRLDGFVLVDAEGDLQAKNNPLRDIAGGKRFLSLPAALHADDFAPNTTSSSTQYAIQFTNGSLPRAQRFEPASVRLWAATRDVEPLDLLAGLRDHLKQGFAKPFKAYHSHLKEMVLVRIYPLGSLGDTAMDDRFCSHMGSAALHNCRVCKVGFKSRKERESAKGFVSYLKIHPLRQAQETIETLRKQIDLAEDDKATKMKDLQTATGVKDKITTEICTNLLEMNDKLKGKVKGIKQVSNAKRVSELRNLRAGFEGAGWYNPLLDLHEAPFFFNIHHRTPQDVLHIFNLGPLKFLASATAALLSVEGKDQLQVRLEAFNTSGLNSPKTLAAAALIKNMGTLVGRERTWLVQAMAIALAPLVEEGFVTQELQDAWRCMGEYGRECYREEVAEEDKESYLANMTNGLGQVVDSYAKIDGEKITAAFKFHGCVHLNADVPRYGVPHSTSCERHETKNGRLKTDSKHSNRSAPSKDIATREITQEFFSHVLDGGLYKNENGVYQPAGAEIRRFAASSVLFRQVYQLGDTLKPYTSGPVLSLPESKDGIKLSTFEFSRFSLDGIGVNESQFKKLSSTHDVFTAGDFALVSLDRNEFSDYGFDSRNMAIEKETNVVKILSFFSSTKGQLEVLSKPFAVVQLLTDREELALYYNMKSFELEEEFGIVPLTSLVCRVSVAHDCIHGECEINETGKTIRIERQDTQFAQPALECSDSTHYVLNSTLYRSSHLVGDLYGAIPVARSFSEVAKDLYSQGGNESD
ncbi:hypothetical protein JCM5350_005612 [Sporobolomyces pararoseus]